jgi:hypothetical protein
MEGQRSEIESVRGAWEVIGLTLRLYRRYPLLFLTLAAGVVAPYELIVLAVSGHGPLSRHLGTNAAIVLPILDALFVTALVSALHMHAVHLLEAGSRPTIAEVAQRGLRSLPAVAATAAAAAVGTFLGLLALVVPGIWLAVHWAVAPQAAALEGEGWVPALRRSVGLTRGNGWHVVGLLLIIGLFGEVVAVAARSLVTGDAADAGPVALGIAERSIVLSVNALALALLYYDLRARLVQPASGASAGPG